MAIKGSCWSDNVKGQSECEREVVEVNLNGYAVAGCKRCKTLLGQGVTPATRNADPYSNGWRHIPGEYLR